MQKAVENLFRLLNEKDARSWIDKFERLNSVSGANKLFKRIANAADSTQLDDYLVEAIYTLTFVGMNFNVVIEPYGIKGPDLEISMDGNSSVVEIMHFQYINPGPPEMNMDDPFATLSVYGNPKRDINKTFQKILGKFRQTKTSDSIIAVWNSDGDLEADEFRLGIQDIRNDAANGLLDVPTGLSFVIYGTGIAKPLFCFPIKQALTDYQEIWRQKIESLFVSTHLARALYAE